ncbi:MAG TPA: hypothetical protein VGB85_15980 [Nannocystis sp.]|jgi:hypothetical protein
MSAKKTEKEMWTPWASRHPEAQNVVITELTTRGFGSELRARKVFKDCGYSKVRADFYQDLDSDKTREIDIVARLPVEELHDAE